MSGAPRVWRWRVDGAPGVRRRLRSALRVRRRPAGGSLRARLRPHLPGELDPAQLGWWGPRGRSALRSPPWHAGRRDGALAEMTAQLAALVALGCSLPEALRRVVRDGTGALLADLAPLDLALVDGWVRDGMPAAAALHRAARTVGCDATGRLAAAAAAPPDDLLPRLRDLACALAQRAHDRRTAVLDALVQIAWLAAALVAAATVRDLAAL